MPAHTHTNTLTQINGRRRMNETEFSVRVVHGFAVVVLFIFCFLKNMFTWASSFRLNFYDLLPDLLLFLRSHEHFRTYFFLAAPDEFSTQKTGIHKNIPATLIYGAHKTTIPNYESTQR